jgi:y4mF family transcriptional regulator
LSGGQNHDNITEREKGKAKTVAVTPEEMGKIIKKERKAMGLTQADLALTSGTGMRFISDLENGKPTCQIGKTLTVLKTLGMRLTLSGQQHSGGG